MKQWTILEAISRRIGIVDKKPTLMVNVAVSCETGVALSGLVPASGIKRSEFICTVARVLANLPVTAALTIGLATLESMAAIRICSFLLNLEVLRK